MKAKAGPLDPTLAADDDRIGALLKEFDMILDQIRASRECTRLLMKDTEARLNRLEQQRRLG